ncbi:MAG: FAD-dependent oxidoreductase, partial [Chloroflexi bacterium]|nr:FAD-dependent oxidoreductase [Chloroflexota bacterium]
NFARDNNLLVSVRGGGHNVAGISICDGGLMIDLSLMKGVRVDPANRTARAEPGVTWGDLDRETQAFGMITPGGIISTTGIAGLTLGGGVGWLVRKHGLTCDNLLSADVVTAEGKLITASATQNADLFWGLRGGGVTLELSPPLSTACIPTATCWAECCSIPGTRPGTCCGSIGILCRRPRKTWACTPDC